MLGIPWTFVRRLLGIVVVAIVGVALGLGLGHWAVPYLPPSIASLLGGASQGHEGPMAGMPGMVDMQGMGPAKRGEREIAFWKSSMIPNFISPRPGMDPMGMELIPVYGDELGQEKLITLSPEVVQNMGLRTAPVVMGIAERTVRTVGQIDYAEPLLGDVTLKVGGWVEKLLVTYVGERVEKGQPLFTFYSPELVSAEEEYLGSIGNPLSQDAGRRSPAGENSSVYPAEDKLRYWDVPDSEIEEIRRLRRPKKTITFQSPYAGWVIEKHAFEGMEMKPGDRFYRIADMSTVWAYVYIYEFQLPWVQVGQEARLTLPYRPGQVFLGKVVYIYPDVDEKTRQIKVRLEFPNPKQALKPEMYANVEIAAQPSGGNLLAPLDAVIYNGKHKQIEGHEQRVGFAYVELAPGQYDPREVLLGEEVGDGNLQILGGLKEGENVVVSGQFQLDSERRVKEANMRMIAAMKGEAQQ